MRLRLWWLIGLVLCTADLSAQTTVTVPSLPVQTTIGWPLTPLATSFTVTLDGQTSTLPASKCLPECLASWIVSTAGAHAATVSAVNDADSGPPTTLPLTFVVAPVEPPPPPQTTCQETPPDAQVVASDGAIWTIGLGNSILRNGAAAGNGVGTIIRSCAGTIFVFSTPNWYQWTGAGYSNVGPTQPGTVVTTPPPPIDATVSDWSAWTGGAWSACMRTMFGDVQTRTETRTRTILQPAQNGGSTPALSETREASQVCTIPPPQPVPTLTVKTCTLNVPAVTVGPDNTAVGWNVQYQRNGQNHGSSDSSSPYGPKSADVAAGSYVMTAIWKKTSLATVTQQLGTVACQ